MSGPYVEQTAEPGEAATTDEALSVPCVWCDADAGEPCKRLATDEIRDIPHASRLRTVPIVAALVAAAEERGARAERERCAAELRMTNHRAVPSSSRAGVLVCAADRFDWPCVIGRIMADLDPS